MLTGKHYYKSKLKYSIIPGRILFLGKVYKINYLHPSYYIKKYFIVVNNKKDNLFEDLILYKCFHPNARGGENHIININYPPKYSSFCLPDFIFGSKFINSEIHQKILKGEIPKPDYNIISDYYLRMAFLRIWALDNPHHEPIEKYVTTTPRLPFY